MRDKAYLGLHLVKWSLPSLSGRRPPLCRLPLCRGKADVGSDEDGREHHPETAGLKTALHGIAGVVYIKKADLLLASRLIFFQYPYSSLIRITRIRPYGFETRKCTICAQIVSGERQSAHFPVFLQGVSISKRCAFLGAAISRTRL